jgi:formylglycine-generating enzyme required for sulfatase activity
MGCNEDYDDACSNDELPYHGTTLDAFEIDEKEVTLVQYAKCVRSRKCPFDGLEVSDAGDEWNFACVWGKRSHENYPMNCVSWEQAEAYCKAYGLRLPTEAEWEKASRGDTGWKYSWGNEGFDTWGNIGVAVANVADKQTKEKYGDLVTWAVSFYDDGSALTQVGMSFAKGKSPYGVYDMIGNVSEWCSDWYGDRYYSAADSRNNPKGPAEGELKIIRGGSWRERLSGDRTSARFKRPPKRRFDDVGFRCAKSL